MFAGGVNLEEIKIENCRSAEPTFATSLLQLESVRVLKYRGCYGNMIHYLDNNNLSLLGRMKGLVKLDLSFNMSVNRNLIYELSSNCDSLAHLNLTCCQGEPFIDDDCLVKLVPMKNLKYLNLSYTCEITDAGLMHLSRIKSLEVLELVGIAYDRLTHVGALMLVKDLPNLTKLDLSGNRGINDFFFNQLEPLGLRRETPLEINLGKTNIPLDDISDAKCFGNIRISVRRTCQTRFRYDRATFYVGGFLPDPEIVFEVESEPEFEDFEDEIENDGIFGIAGNWSGEILVRHYDDEDW
jgi:Leucine-rich repeat (LRR) protein